MLVSTMANGPTGLALKPKVWFVVLNWNNPGDTLDCLQSLREAGLLGVVVVVDNGSTDNSVAEIKMHYPDITILATGANLGYAGGNNVGIRYALSQGVEVIGVLNNDVVVEPGFLAPLLAALESQPDVGVVTPLIAERSEGGSRVWALGSSVDQRTATVSRNQAGALIAPWLDRPPFDVDIASGAAMLVKGEVLKRVGLMDQGFFLYYEEVDWSLAVRQNGYRILAVPSAVVWHKVSATLGKTSPAIDYYMLRNHLRLIGRHWSGVRRYYLWARVVLRNLAVVAAYTLKPNGKTRIPNRNARVLALRDAMLGRWGEMGSDVARVCYPHR